MGIGLDDDGHLVEFIGDWRALAELQDVLSGPDTIYVQVDDWQVLAVDDELRLPLGREAMVERKRFLASALAHGK